MLTLREVIEWLKRLDEVTLLEVLDISSEELVNRFEDKIEDQYDELAEDIEEEDADEEEISTWGR
jgi:hypothetical protein